MPAAERSAVGGATVDGSTLEGVEWIRLVFVDVFGALHSLQLPAGRFADAVAHGTPFDGSALEGRARHIEADMLLRPDPGSVVHLGDGLARAACTVVGPDGMPWPGDPRTALSHILGEVDSLAAWTAAAELEFYVLDTAGVPVDGGGYYAEVEGPGMAAARAAATNLEAHGIEVLSAHHEAGPGQFELDLGPLGPLQLADALVLAKEVVRRHAADRGLRATFMARPFSDQPGSGLHLHQRVGDRLFERGRLDPDGDAFVAGLLAHARGLSALAAPNVNSYKRLHAGPEAPAAVVWAHSNRAALVRVGAAGPHEPAVEYRGADPSANPYLLVAGLLAAAAHGLEAGLELEPPFEEEVGGFDPAARSVRFDPLPHHLDEALDALLSDDVLVDAFDNRLLSRLVAGRRAEAEAYRAHVTRWELDRYCDEA